MFEVDVKNVTEEGRNGTEGTSSGLGSDTTIAGLKKWYP